MDDLSLFAAVGRHQPGELGVNTERIIVGPCSRMVYEGFQGNNPHPCGVLGECRPGEMTTYCAFHRAEIEAYRMHTAAEQNPENWA